MSLAKILTARLLCMIPVAAAKQAQQLPVIDHHRQRHQSDKWQKLIEATWESSIQDASCELPTPPRSLAPQLRQCCEGLREDCRQLQQAIAGQTTSHWVMHSMTVLSKLLTDLNITFEADTLSDPSLTHLRAVIDQIDTQLILAIFQILQNSDYVECAPLVKEAHHHLRSIEEGAMLAVANMMGSQLLPAFQVQFEALMQQNALQAGEQG